jgi:hypothetical protein
MRVEVRLQFSGVLGALDGNPLAGIVYRARVAVASLEVFSLRACLPGAATSRPEPAPRICDRSEHSGS